MSTLQYYDYPGWGTWAKKAAGLSQAVRVGDRIECSGQGGWREIADGSAPGDDFIPKGLNEEIDLAFVNVDKALKAAGGKGWTQVYHVTSFHTVLTPETEQRMTYNYRKWMPDHSPIWTEIGVAKLGLENMRVEIEVSAYDPEGAVAAKKA